MAEVTRVYPMKRQPPEPLWREVLGSRLRALRADRDETLAETAQRAGISPQYLSEIERGRKEPSSEMIAALAGALDATLADLTTAVTEDLRRTTAVTEDLGRSPRAPASHSARPRHVMPPPRALAATAVRPQHPLPTSRAPHAPHTPSTPDVLALAA
jgi:transcriptional regulator with XRE-family HTH domain